MNKILVSYFSATGTTKNVALKVGNIFKADLFEIVPVSKYTNADLDWTDKESRSTKEANDISIRPEIKEKVENIDDYDTVIIGFPVWWYKAPSIINTFIEENNLVNKNVYIFVTSGGSSYESSLNNLRQTYKNINFVNGKRLSNDSSEDEIKNFVNN